MKDRVNSTIVYILLGALVFALFHLGALSAYAFAWALVHFGWL